MNEQFQTLRIRRNFLTIGFFVALCIGCGYTLVLTIESRGSVALVFLLGVGTLTGFFVSLLAFFLPYLRVDDDRIIIQHDILRKDILFFYDLTSIHFDDNRSIGIKHLNGMTRISFNKLNAHDKKLVLAFFKELGEEKAIT